MKRIVFFGTPDFSSPFLQALIDDSRFDVVGIVAQPDRPVGRKQELTAPPTAAIAKENNIPLLQPEKVRKNDSFFEELKAFNADAFIVIAYGHILPQRILDTPAHGVINVHPSLLPRYRGPSPLQAVLRNGDTETGISIMLMDSKMDHGPLLSQTSFELPQHMHMPQLIEKVHMIGVPLLLDTTFDYLEGSIQPVEQDHGAATICSLLSREDGFVHLNHSATDVYNMFRAYYPWPGVTLQVEEGIQYKLHAVEAPDTQITSNDPSLLVHNDLLYLAFPDGAVQILELQEAGKQRMSAENFIHGLSSGLQSKSALRLQEIPE